MSYLDVPRLHFTGTFMANPSTINNDPLNYDPKILNFPNPNNPTTPASSCPGILTARTPGR
jgi:hypothetical protein